MANRALRRSRRNINDQAARLRPPTIRWIGDSIGSQNHTALKPASNTTSIALTAYPYYINLLHWAMGRSFNCQTMLNISDAKRYGSNSCVGGRDMSDILSATPSYDAILGSMPESHLFFMLGTNDVNSSSMTLGTLNARWDYLNTRALNAGKTPIWTTVLPRNAVDGGGNDWSNTTTSTANRRKMWAAHNLYRRRRCLELGLICSDIASEIMDASGNAKTGMTVDGLHLSEWGHFCVFKRIMGDIGHLFPQRAGGRNIYNVYDSTYNPYGNYLNGAFTGTGGSLSAGSGAGTVTGTVPDNWQLAKQTTTTTSVNSVIVPRTDGLPGNVMELTFTSLGTGTSTDNFRLAYWTGSSTSLSGYANAGDYMQMCAEIEKLGGHGGCGGSVGLRLADSSTITTGALTTLSFDATAKTVTASSGTPFSSFLANRIVNINGGTNPGVFKVVSVNGGGASLTLGSTYLNDVANLVTAAAGASITCTIPTNAVVTGGSSATVSPDEDTPVLPHCTPIFTSTRTGNLVCRLDFYVNGTIPGVFKVRVGNPELFKLESLPAVCTFLADDN